MPAVSVILPIYNIKENALRKCLDSIRIQTFSDFEAIMVDDGSEDYVGKVCSFYAKQDARFLYVRQDNGGVCVARNKGLSLSVGEYICFIDPDDWIERDYLKQLVQIIKDTDSDIAVCDCTVYYGERTVPNRFLNTEKTILKDEDKNLLLYQLVGKKICAYYPPEIAAGVPWAKIYRKSFLIQNDLTFIPGMKRMEDNIFNLYAFETARQIAYAADFLYCYRKEAGSASYRFDPELISHFEKYYEETEKFLNAYHKEQILYDALSMKELTSFNSYLNYYYYCLKEKSTHEVNRMIDEQLKKEPYASALSKVSSKLLTKQEYIFVTALKYRMYGLLRLLIKARSAIKK